MKIEVPDDFAQQVKALCDRSASALNSDDARKSQYELGQVRVEALTMLCVLAGRAAATEGGAR